MYPAHIAVPAYDLEKSRKFYTAILGCSEKRSAVHWVDFDFFGHQLTVHLVRERFEKPETQLIDGDQIPARHFGVILTKESWEALRVKLAGENGTFVIGPKLRFAGDSGEQWTMFIVDPAGNYLEFKYFTDTSRGAWY